MGWYNLPRPRSYYVYDRTEMERKTFTAKDYKKIVLPLAMRMCSSRASGGST